MAASALHRIGSVLALAALAVCALAVGCAAPDSPIKTTSSANSIVATDFPSGTVTAAGFLAAGAEDQGGFVLSEAGGDGWSGELYIAMDRAGLYRRWDMNLPAGSSVRWPDGTTSIVQPGDSQGSIRRVGQKGQSVEVTVTGVAARDGVTFDAVNCEIGPGSTAPLSADIAVVDLSGPASGTFDVTGSLWPFDSAQTRKATRVIASISPFDVESADGSMPQVIQFVVLDDKTALLRKGVTLSGGLAALPPIDGPVQVRARIEVRDGTPYAVELDVVE